MTSKLRADMDGWGEAQLLSRLGITWVPGDRTDQLIEKHFDALRAELAQERNERDATADMLRELRADYDALRAENARLRALLDHDAEVMTAQSERLATVEEAAEFVVRCAADESCDGGCIAMLAEALVSDKGPNI